MQGTTEFIRFGDSHERKVRELGFTLDLMKVWVSSAQIATLSIDQPLGGKRLHNKLLSGIYSRQSGAL